MRQSQLFAKTKKEAPKEAKTISHKLLVRGDFIEQTISGVYRFLPLGFKVLKKIEKIIREEMENLGAQELYLPVLQNKNLWMETNRWQTIDPPLFKLKDRHQKETALGPTHEEEITDIVRKRIRTYQDLPFFLFQIQDKFRNEMRPSGGLLRTREFLMKDLYSFHCDEKDLLNFYQKVKKSYFKIFQRCGLKPVCVQASSGAIGGKLSEEFMVLSDSGEDRILICQKCSWAANVERTGEIKKCPECNGPLQIKNAIELGHIFNLGKKYSEAMKANFRDKDGQDKPILMGCYGIGLPRLMATIVEVHHDAKGIIWPKEVAPFQVHLVSLENNAKVKRISEKLYRDLFRTIFKLDGSAWRKQKKMAGDLQKTPCSPLTNEVLYDDRKDKTLGEKLIDSDLIGIPVRIVVSERTLEKNCLEIKQRDKKEFKLVKINSFNVEN